MNEFSVIIPGEPVAKGRPRMTRTGRAYTPKKTEEYESLIKRCWCEQNGVTLLSGTLYVVVECFMRIPESWSKKKKLEAAGAFHTNKPDLDNMIKAALDGLNGIAYLDDSCIASITAVKKYAEIPHMKVTVGEL